MSASQHREEGAPSVTVISPSLNQGRFIGDCLASVALQGDYDYEHLILDAGSTDETEEVVARFPRARLVSLPGSSQSEALNAGFEQARGRIVCWLNTDDVLMPGAFDQAIEHLDRMGPNGYVTSYFLLVDQDQELLQLQRMPRFSPFLYRNGLVYLPSSGSFVTNTLAEHGVALQDDLHMVMDRDFHLQLHRAGFAFAVLPSYLSAFRVHDSNKSEIQASLERKADRKASAGASQRLEEAQRLNALWGGVHLGGRRLLPPHRLWSLLAKLTFVAGLRYRTWLSRRQAREMDEQRSRLAAWKASQHAHRSQMDSTVMEEG